MAAILLHRHRRVSELFPNASRLFVSRRVVDVALFETEGVACRSELTLSVGPLHRNALSGFRSRTDSLGTSIILDTLS
jgi:hypothetical protein